MLPPDQLTRIKDLFAFIPTFGKQTFPVLQESAEEPVPPIAPTDTISVVANDISFAYDDQNVIFYHNYLSLAVPFNQISKLYGIIGPSGMGKKYPGFDAWRPTQSTNRNGLR